MARVRAGARLHVGFQNLSLAHERLYGGIGISIEEPYVEISAEPAPSVDCEDGIVRTYAHRVVEHLGVPGARITVDSMLNRHVGLGSGTQVALAIYAAIATAHDEPIDPRAAAPVLGRGGRSGVGVAGFERGGLVVDGGHPSGRFTTEPPDRGDWDVPPVIARHELPEDWRFVVVVPAASRGRNGADEESSIREVIETAPADLADDVLRVLYQTLLPAAAEGRIDAVGDALTEIGRLNGAWYTDQQGGVYRPPVGTVLDTLSASPAIAGVGQSSWGPTAYGLTTAGEADRARDVAETALESAGVDGTVYLTAVDNDGAQISATE